MKISVLITCLAACLSGMFSSAASTQQEKIDPPIMGWSSWNTYRVNINEELIKIQAEAMVSTGLKDAGYNFINIDDGFFGWRDEKGRLHTHPERFPNGLKGIVDYIHSRGLNAGIYSDAGRNTCGSIWDNDKNGVGVGLYGFEHQDADFFFNELGFDFIKIDYCGAGQMLDLDEEERYTTIVGAIRTASPKRHISVSICRWAYPGTWVKGLAHSWRISPDITPDWGGVRSCLDHNLYLSAYAGDGHYNDMDMLEMGRGLSPDEENTHFGMWCIMSSPLLIGCDLTKIPERTLKLLTNKELIALNQDPLGLQAYVVQEKDGGFTLVKDILQRQGNSRAVAFYNPSDKKVRFSVGLNLLGFEGKTKVRDLIARKDLGTVTDKVEHEVPPHGSMILRLDGTKRIEQTRYEAEHAYLHRFDNLKKRPRAVAYTRRDGASCNMVVTNLGGHEDNYARWDNVYSEKGGKYRMTIRYVPTPKLQHQINDRCYEVYVNGKCVDVLRNLASAPAKDITTVDLTVTLMPGFNKIRIGSSYTWTPDLDCFDLTPL